MRQANCPSCGGQLTFQCAVSVFAVCPYCNSTVLRTDRDVELIGKMSFMDNDWSPVQLQTRGKFHDSNFTTAGRLKRDWADGSWNEWFLKFDDGKHGWLSEAQGFYSIGFPSNETSEIPKVTELSPGKRIKLQDRTFSVADMKRSTVNFVEGELPFAPPLGQETISVDLSGLSGGFACIEYVRNETLLYVGEYLDFDQIQFVGLREIDGWDAP